MYFSSLFDFDRWKSSTFSCNGLCVSMYFLLRVCIGCRLPKEIRRGQACRCCHQTSLAPHRLPLILSMAFLWGCRCSLAVCATSERVRGWCIVDEKEFFPTANRVSGARILFVPSFGNDHPCPCYTTHTRTLVTRLTRLTRLTHSFLPPCSCSLSSLLRSSMTPQRCFYDSGQKGRK